MNSIKELDDSEYWYNKGYQEGLKDNILKIDEGNIIKNGLLKPIQTCLENLPYQNQLIQK